jgi:hypothetical protein
MNLSTLSPLAFAGGLLGLAGLLYLLQRLRVRHREVDVVTTLFWHEAVHETRARVLVQRFRHPWAYVLVLAIAALLWTAIAGPQRSEEPVRDYVLVLDSSAASSHGARFEEARSRLLELVEEAPREAREVVVSGATIQSLLLPGEESLLLEERLRGVESEAAPSRLGETLLAIARRHERPTTVVVLGDAPLSEAELALLPETISVERVVFGVPGAEPVGNAGITQLGLASAASGAWDTVDVLVQVSSDPSMVVAPALSLDGQPLVQSVTRRDLGAGRAEYLLRDVPARGGRLEARLSAGDSSPLDDVAAVVLPNRPLLRVQLAPGLPESLRSALAADPAVVLVESEPALVVRRASDALGAGLPAIVLVPAAAQEQSFLVQEVGERAPDAVLSEVLGALALNEIDATSLADSAGQPISVGASSGPVREVALWEELVGDGFDFVGSRAFPLFIGGSLRWLSGARALTPFVAAGETRIATTTLTGASGAAQRPLGEPAVPLSAGDYTLQDGAKLTASLLSADATSATPSGDVLDPLAEASGGASDPITWLLLLAVLLLLFEWRQVRAGRMP